MTAGTVPTIRQFDSIPPIGVYEPASYAAGCSCGETVQTDGPDDRAVWVAIHARRHCLVSVHEPVPLVPTDDRRPFVFGPLAAVPAVVR